MTDASDQTLRTNLELFRRAAPPLHERIREVLERGAGTADVAAHRSQIMHCPLGPPPNESIDVQTFDFLDNLLAAAGQDGIAFFDSPRDAESYFLLIVNPPNGAQLRAALETCRPRVLMIAITDHDALAASMAEIDWTVPFRHMQGAGGSVIFITETDVGGIMDQTWQICRLENPMRMDNFTALVTGPDAVRSAFQAELPNMVGLSMRMLGFFHDGTVMLWNTYTNLRSGKGHRFARGALARQGVEQPAVCVVGSGPSLNADLPVIQAHRDNVVVVSAASALRPLLDHGIIPDFHVELENVYIATKFDELAADHDVSDLTLVAAASVEARALDHVKRAVLFSRTELTSYPLFAQSADETLSVPGPTAGNTALCFALESGFTDIYLFGLDLGTTDPAQHHAAGSFYESETAFAHTDVYDIRVPGNFAEHVFTSQTFLNGLKNLEALTHGFRDRATITNCSGGVKIAHTITTASAEIAPRGGTLGFSGPDGVYPPIPRADAEWPRAALCNAVNDVAERLVQILGEAKTLSDRSYMANLLTFLDLETGYRRPPARDIKWSALFLFRGTIIACVAMMERYRNRVARAEDLEPFALLAASQLVDCIHGLRDEALALFDHEAPKQPPSIAHRSADASRSLPDPVRVPRNSECPCGSGRKYKHCHGRIGGAAVR